LYTRERERERDGLSPVAAALDACRLRLRPILMTSLAFIMGVVPLVLARGAGAEMRNAMGVAVFGGMLGVTLFGLLFTPLSYVAIRSLTRRRERHIPAHESDPAGVPPQSVARLAPANAPRG